MNGFIGDLVRILFLTAALAWMTSCADKKPADVLSREKMVQTMSELYVAEEKINRLGIGRDSAEKVFEAMKVRVFDSVALTDSVFKRSFDYYMARPAEMEFIYTALVDTLQLREQRAPLDAK